MPSFVRYIGIDYSGAATPTTSLNPLRVYQALGSALPEEVRPPQSRKKHWTRKGLAEWLVEQLTQDGPTLVGIDHGFSFPLKYFEKYELNRNWPSFLDDFQGHWPTDKESVSVESVLQGTDGSKDVRTGDARWKRLTEKRTGRAKSVFHFGVPGSVAKSTHAGIPWLRFIRQRLSDRIHFWPFDGWRVPDGRSVIAEVYPALWNDRFPSRGRTTDQHDAFSIAAWMSKQDQDGTLVRFLEPKLAPNDMTLAQIEGWILGVRSSSEKNADGDQNTLSGIEVLPLEKCDTFLRDSEEGAVRVSTNMIKDLGGRHSLVKISHADVGKKLIRTIKGHRDLKNNQIALQYDDRIALDAPDTRVAYYLKIEPVAEWWGTPRFLLQAHPSPLQRRITKFSLAIGVLGLVLGYLLGKFF